VLARAFIILFASFLASLAGGAIVLVAAIYPAWSRLAVDPEVVEGVLGYLVTFGAIFLSFFSLLPWLLVVILAESYAIRSLLFYALAGAGTAVLLYLNASNWSTLAFSVDGFARRELEVIAAAGIVLGFVYWALAGRKAGAWRGLPVEADREA
jgi:hypothetical protein